MLDSVDAFLAQRRPRPTPPRPWRRDLTSAVGIGLAILVAAYLLQPAVDSTGPSWSIGVVGAASVPAPAIGRAAPEFEVLGLDGQPVRLSSFRGRPVWLNFFATWCPPCRAENPDIEATYQALQRQGSDVVIVALSLGEDADTVREYTRKAGLTYLVGLDSDTEAAATYRVTGLPTHIFIDREGIARSIRVGGLQPEMMRRELARIQ